MMVRNNKTHDPSAELEEYEGDPPILDEGKATLWELLPEITSHSFMITISGTRGTT